MTKINFSQCYTDFIIHAVEQQGEIISLSHFCIENGLDYSYAHYLVRRLNLLGVLTVKQLPGQCHPLSIRKGSVPYVT
jgi:hypothetical protein